MIVIFLFLGSCARSSFRSSRFRSRLSARSFSCRSSGSRVNLLTLLAIVLSVGLVVDDAIVVVENVERHLREGLSPLNAALLGARELVGPIIAMTITLAAVYIPIGIQGGLTGTLFREFAFTLAGAVAISGVVALTLSPVMTAKFLRAGDDERGFAGKVNQTFDRLRDWYGRQARCDLARAAGCLRRLDRAHYHRRDHVCPDADVRGQGTRAHRRPGSHFRDHDRSGRFNHRTNIGLCRRRRKGFPELSADGIHIPTDLPE